MSRYLKGWEAMTDQELADMSIEERNRVLDAWAKEVDEDLRAEDYAELVWSMRVDGVYA